MKYYKILTMLSTIQIAWDCTLVPEGYTRPNHEELYIKSSIQITVYKVLKFFSANSSKLDNLPPDFFTNSTASATFSAVPSP